MSRSRHDAPSDRPRGAVCLGRFLGVPIHMSASWLLVLALITVAFADFFRRAVPGSSGAGPYLLAAAYAILSALCVLIHELGHVVAALMLRLRVRRVLIHLLGGATEIDPEPQRPGPEAIVSAAGPIASLVVFAVTAFGAAISPADSAIGAVLELLAWSNLLIAAFNALPGLPLDGGRVLRAAVWGLTRSRLRGTIAAAWGGRVVAVAVAVSGLVVPELQFQVIWVALTAGLGAFLWFSAGQSIAAARAQERIPELRVRDLLRPAVYLPADTSLARALEELWRVGARAIVVLDGAGRPGAIVTEARVERIPAASRAWVTVAEVATGLAGVPPVDLDLPGRAVLDLAARHPAPDYLVVKGADPVGVLCALDLRHALTRPDTPGPNLLPKVGR